MAPFLKFLGTPLPTLHLSAHTLSLLQLPDLHTLPPTLTRLRRCSEELLDSHVKSKDNRRTTSVTQLMSKLGWESLTYRRQNARLSMFYKGLHGLASIPTHQLQQPSRTTRHASVNTCIPLSTRIDAYKYSFFPRTVVNWNSLTDEVRLKPSLSSSQSSLPYSY